MKKMLSMLTAVMICSFFLCSCGSGNIKVKVKEAQPIDLIEAVQSEPIALMVSSSDTDIAYLFLGEDVLSSTFKKKVYTIDGLDFTLNEPLSNIFSSNSDTYPFYLNKKGLLYITTPLVANVSEEKLSCIKNNELIEVAKKKISMTYGKYVVTKTDLDNGYEIRNLDTNDKVEFISDSSFFSVKPMNDGFLYSYLDEKKYSDFIEAAKADEEMISPVFDLPKYVYPNLDMFFNYKVYNSEMLNPIDLESPIALGTESLIELVKHQQSSEENDHAYNSMAPTQLPITSYASNIVLWLDQDSKTIHMQDISQVVEKNEAPKATSFTVTDAPIDQFKTHVNPDGSIKCFLIQDTLINEYVTEVTFSTKGIESTNYVLPDYCISPQFLSYDKNGNFVIIYWRENLKNYQLGILKNNTKELVVRNINLPNNIENIQGYNFHLIGDLKAKDEKIRDVYWFSLTNPNTDRLSKTKSIHILRCIMPL